MSRNRFSVMRGASSLRVKIMKNLRKLEETKRLKLAHGIRKGMGFKETGVV